MLAASQAGMPEELKSARMYSYGDFRLASRSSPAVQSANPSDYFMQEPDYRFRGWTLQQRVGITCETVSGKHVLALGWADVKHNPTKADLIDLTS